MDNETHESQLVHLIEQQPPGEPSIRSMLEGSPWPVRVYADTESFLLQGRPAWGSVVVDAAFADYHGVDLLGRMMRRSDRILPTVLISRTISGLIAVEAFLLGAVDVIEQPIDKASLLERVGMAMRIGPRSHGAAAKRGDWRQVVDTLTPRERNILWRLLAGHSNKQVAADLALSDKTVATHRHNFLIKFGQANLMELVHQIIPRAVLRDHPRVTMLDQAG
jgi:FixJ family two-component response regulator